MTLVLIFKTPYAVRGITRIELIQILLIIAIMACVTFVTTSLSIWFIYHTSLEQQRKSLIAIGRSQASLIKAIKRFDRQYIENHIDGDWKSATFRQISSALDRSDGLRKTGELVFGHRKGDKIVIIAPSRLEDKDSHLELPYGGNRSLPMQLAIDGEEGIIRGKDYDGSYVLAAHIPLPELSAGLVVKIDLSEFIAPYRRAVMAALGIGLLFASLGGYLIWLLGNNILSKLQSSERRYRTLVDNVHLGICLKQDNGKFLTANHAYCSLFGINHSQLPTLRDEDIYPKENVEKHSFIDKQILKEKTVVLGDDELVINGKRRIIQYIKCPLQDDASGETYILGIHQDVTEDRDNVQAIVDLNTNLEAKVLKHTGQLEQLNQELESFAYSVSHDLRAPLRAMTDFSVALRDDYGDKMDATAKAYITHIDRATQGMAELIDAILTLSRSTRGELDHKDIDLSKLAQDVAADLRRTDEKRKIKITIASGLYAKGDRRLLRNVLENLMGNAWKYTSKTLNPRMKIGFEELTPPGDTQEPVPTVYIKDNGAGFDMAYANKLFRPFQRLSSDPEFKGTGIGLATVERIIHRHDGHIWAEAAPGIGATFYFTLPELTRTEHEAKKYS